MRVKLGPYELTADFWQRLQQLPGDNDEQRVVMALTFACEHVEALTRQQVEGRAEMMRMAQAELAAERAAKAEQFVDAVVEEARERGGIEAIKQATIQNLVTGMPQGIVVPEEGPIRVATPDEMADLPTEAP